MCERCFIKPDNGDKAPVTNGAQPIVIYTPPAGVNYVTRPGIKMFGKPVYDSTTASHAAKVFSDKITDYIFEGKNGWNAPAPNMERLFKLYDAVGGACYAEGIAIDFTTEEFHEQ